MIKRLIVSILFVFISINFVAQSKLNQFDENGKRHGVWKKLFRNGNKRYVGQFEHGKEIGTFKFYAITGEEHPMVEKEFSQGSDIVKVTYYSTKGLLESQGKMNGKDRIGSWNYYFPDGKTLLSTESYKEGLLDGEANTYYKDGKLNEIAHYKAGKLHGNRIRYDDKEKQTENLTFKAGTIHGPAIIYDEKGEVFARGNYENGIKTGIWEFNMDGEMVKSEPDKILKK